MALKWTEYQAGNISEQQIRGKKYRSSGERIKNVVFRDEKRLVSNEMVNLNRNNNIVQIQD